MKQKHFLLPILMTIAFIFITVSAICSGQSFLRIVPLYISLIVALLQSRVNRYAPLLGGINSILYFIVYLYYRLYVSAVFALAISFPIQIITFIRWSRHPWKNSTELKKMSNLQRAVVTLGSITAWLIFCFVLSKTDAQYREIDTAITIVGIVASFLTMLSYYEYTVFMLISGTLSITLYTLMLKSNPEQITYLGYSVYSLICQMIAFRNIHILYQEQREERKKEKL